MSQAELAAAAGLKRPWISLFEGGHLPNAAIGRIFAMCEALGMSIRVSYPIPEDHPGTHPAVIGPAEEQHGATGAPITEGESAPAKSRLDPAALAVARAQRSAHRARADGLARGALDG